MTSSVPPALRALLTGSVDFAGLFPPATLPLDTALENHAAYVGGDDAWMLGRFVLPAGKLVEAGSMLAGRFDAGHPLRVSALGSKATSASEFLSNLRQSLDEVTRFTETHRGQAKVDQFEAPFPSVAPPEIVPTLVQAAELIGNFIPWPLQVFWELPLGDQLPTILRCFAEHHAEVAHAGHGSAFGVKLRTGGTEAAAFPTGGQLAAALVAARDADVALKFTAGLHHPVRHFDETLGTHMHGFLNVFAAGVLAREHSLDAAETQAVLEDERPESFHFDADGLAWRGRRASMAALSGHRQFVTSFGSCSFDEPRDDLRHLGLLA